MVATLSTLGAVQVLLMHTPNLHTSITFYKKLGFEELMFAEWPNKWIMITDGTIQILLMENPLPNFAITYFVTDVAEAVTLLEQNGLICNNVADLGLLHSYELTSVEGVKVWLANKPEGYYRPSKPTLLHFPQADFFNPDLYPNKKCGIFGEVAIPVLSLDKSIHFWQALGYKVVSHFTHPYPWAILYDELGVVGLHQASEFDTPALTYFAADMKEKLQALVAEEIGDIDYKGDGNGSLCTPELQKINLFKLGM